MQETSVVCFGEMLWDLLPGKSLPGGAVMNVAYHLHKLGEPVKLVSKVGNDERGKQLLEILSGYGLPTEYVQVDAERQTGIVHADMTDPSAVKYDIVYPVAWDFIEYSSSVMKGNDYFVFGSLCARDKVSRATLEKFILEAGARVLDINLRAPHYTTEFITWLLQHCDILKLNLDELVYISSWYRPFEGTEAALRLLADKFNIPVIVVTMGSDGAMLLQHGSLFREQGKPVKVADTIGSGDAFLAGFLHARRQQKTPEDSLRLANALGALVATYHGGCPEYDTRQLPL